MLPAIIPGLGEALAAIQGVRQVLRDGAMKEVEKVLFRDSKYEIKFYAGRTYCGCEMPYGRGAPLIVVARKPSEYSYSYGRDLWITHWHTKRFWGRNRTTSECVQLAMDWVREAHAEERRAELEAELAEEHAKDLAELANDLNTEIPCDGRDSEDRLLSEV